MKKIAIIGAGISGITLANELKKISEVKVFEKSNGIGGRLSVRRKDFFFFNHGCPYFDVNSSTFSIYIQNLISQNKLKKLKLNENKNKNFYKGVPFMNSFLKPLDNNFNVYCKKKIKNIIYLKNRWKILDQDDISLGLFDWVISTIPPQQAYDIIPDGVSFKKFLSSIYMESCLTLMIGYEDYNNKIHDNVINYDNFLKKIIINKIENQKRNLFSIVCHSSDEWAKKNFSHSPKKIMDILIEKTISNLCLNSKNILVKDYQKWKFSTTNKNNKIDFFLDDSMNLAACGDWCKNGTVEGAFTSAKNLSKTIKNFLI